VERQEELAGEPSVDLWPAGQPTHHHPLCRSHLPLQLTWQAFSKKTKKYTIIKKNNVQFLSRGKVETELQNKSL
jgi:hypothetical protein